MLGGTWQGFLNRVRNREGAPPLEGADKFTEFQIAGVERDMLKGSAGNSYYNA